MKYAIVLSALLSFSAPSHIRVPLGHHLSLTLLTSGLSYSDTLAALHPSALPFSARYPDADAGLYGDERTDLASAPAIGAVLTLHVPF